MSIKTAPYDTADYLTDDESVSEYLTEALESEDSKIISQALGTVARARGGIAQLAKDTGISSEDLCNALSEFGNLELEILLKVMRAFGVRLSATLVA